MPTLGIPGRARILMSPFDQRIKLFLPPFLSLSAPSFSFLSFMNVQVLKSSALRYGLAKNSGFDSKEVIF